MRPPTVRDTGDRGTKRLNTQRTDDWWAVALLVIAVLAVLVVSGTGELPDVGWVSPWSRP